MRNTACCNSLDQAAAAARGERSMYPVETVNDIRTVLFPLSAMGFWQAPPRLERIGHLHARIDPDFRRQEEMSPCRGAC